MLDPKQSPADVNYLVERWKIEMFSCERRAGSPGNYTYSYSQESSHDGISVRSSVLVFTWLLVRSDHYDALGDHQSDILFISEERFK